MKTKITAIILAITLLSGCALFKGVMNTVNDLAESLCDVMGTSPEAAGAVSIEEMCKPIDELDGFSLAEFCAIHGPLSPFIRVILTENAEQCVAAGTDAGRLDSALDGAAK